MAVGEVLLAGGGTAGHLAPGLALREALSALGVATGLVTPGEARERAWLPAGEPEPLHVPAPRLPRRAVPAALFPLRMGGSVGTALALLRRRDPRAVVALGGWPCAPTALAALVAGIPLALVAVDAVPGVVVRRLAPYAGRVYLADERARAHLPHPEAALVVGPMVRRSASEGTRDATRFGLERGRKTLFVVGGSLGASGLNAAAVAGLVAAVERDPSLVGRLQVIHSAGAGADGAVRAAYDAHGIRAFVAPFVEAMGDALATADLVLCRGGASTLAEVAFQGRPAVVVPYPHHADRQQWKNAEALVRRGLATVVEEARLSPSAFALEVLGPLLASSPSLAGASGGDARPAASGAALAARDLVRWIEGGARPPAPPPAGRPARTPSRGEAVRALALAKSSASNPESRGVA